MSLLSWASPALCSSLMTIIWWCYHHVAVHACLQAALGASAAGGDAGHVGGGCDSGVNAGQGTQVEGTAGKQLVELQIKRRSSPPCPPAWACELHASFPGWSSCAGNTARRWRFVTRRDARRCPAEPPEPAPARSLAAASCFIFFWLGRPRPHVGDLQ